MLKMKSRIFFFIISHTWRKQFKFSSMITDASYSTFMWISGKELTTHAYIYSSFRLAYKYIIIPIFKISFSWECELVVICLVYNYSRVTQDTQQSTHDCRLATIATNVYENPLDLNPIFSNSSQRLTMW